MKVGKLDFSCVKRTPARREERKKIGPSSLYCFFCEMKSREEVNNRVLITKIPFPIQFTIDQNLT
jgi:hypothetical protein